MFDISFSELLVISIVALIVIGPEKLPKVARTAGAFMGRLQRFVTQVKEEVNREARFEELQKLQQEIEHGVQQVETGLNSEVQKIVEEPKPKVRAKTKTSPKKMATDAKPAKKITARKPKADI